MLLYQDDGGQAGAGKHFLPEAVDIAEAFWQELAFSIA